MVTDILQNYRIEALERALAALTDANHAAPQQQQPVSYQAHHPAPSLPAQQNPPAQRPDGRIDTLENSVLALTNSVMLLNQQIANLTAEMQRQSHTANMITISPATVDDAQDKRLNNLDKLVRSLSKDVSDYNQQMADLITQYKSINARMATMDTFPGARMPT